LPAAYSITSSARAEEQRRDGDAERLGGLEVDDQLEFGRLLCRFLDAGNNEALGTLS
jgi:hypothetical protein